jgi:hypothetical protein
MIKTIAFLLSCFLAGVLIALAINAAVAQSPMVRLEICHSVKDETLTDLYGPRHGNEAWFSVGMVAALVSAAEEGCTVLRFSDRSTVKVEGNKLAVYCKLFKSPLCPEPKK